MYGLWGEIRDWSDGSTIVQKTHDASKAHVLNVGVLEQMLLRFMIRNNSMFF